MFGFSWGEILLIGIVALIAIGPKELPGVLREFGRFMGKVRRMADEFRDAFDQLSRETDAAEMRRMARTGAEKIEPPIIHMTPTPIPADPPAASELLADKPDDRADKPSF